MRRTLAALALAMALPTAALLAPAARAQAVVVKAGETLSEIAERHGVSLSRLMQTNGISDPDLVVVGQRLTIPGGSGRAGGSASARGGRVTVQEGDTLSAIAERHGVGLTRLMQANGISDADLVVVGERLTIPAGSGGSGASAARSQPTAPYTVKSGETLSEIAVRFNTSTSRLIELNAIQNPDQVNSGTRLRIPMTANRGTAKPAAKAPVKAASAAAKPSTPDRKTQEHEVQGGESLSAIAERYGTSVSQLVALNSIDDPDRLLAGSTLKLRGTPPAAKPKPAASPTPQAAAKPAPAPVAQPAPQAQPRAQAKAPAAATSQPAVAAASSRPAPQSRAAAPTSAAAAGAAAAASAAAPKAAAPKPQRRKPQCR